MHKNKSNAAIAANSEGVPDKAQSWYLEIKRLAKSLRRPVETLIAQTETNDPFYLTPSRLERAQWFTDLYERFQIKPGAHVRRMHYVFVSQKSLLQMPDGRDYENTENCWQVMKEASRDARLKGLVNALDFDDHRNNETVVHLANDASEAEIFISGEDNEIVIPEWPELQFARVAIGRQSMKWIGKA